MNNDLISRSALKKAYFNAINETSIGEVSIIELIDNAPTVKTYCYFCGQTEHGRVEERPQGDCKSCRHRDPEDKKCDCGALERQGCPFPVSDDYYCKYYEKGGAE